VKEAPPFLILWSRPGLLYIEGNDGSDSSKVWVALYTCCVTTQTFLRFFRRFTARRGIPVQVISDNAKTFVSASLTLDKMLNNPEAQ